MGFRINTNVSSMNSHRVLGRSDRALSLSLERLSSGLRVNRASDDAGGLAVSETMRAQVLGNQRAAKNIQDAISLLGVADGGLTTMSAMLQRMRELAVQASNGTLTDADRLGIQAEFTELRGQFNTITSQTAFNGLEVFTGVGGMFTTSPLRTSTATTELDTGGSIITFGGATAALPGAPGNRVINLPTMADNYAAPPSIQVTLTGVAPPSSRVLPPASFSFDPMTGDVTLLGGGNPTASENAFSVRYVPLGANSLALTSAPLAGSEAVTVGGVAVPPGGGNGYSIAGNILTLNGTSRLAAAGPSNLQVGYTSAGTTSIVLDTSNPFFSGAILNAGTLNFTVNGVPTAFSSPADYTLTQSVVDAAGQTPLYGYTVTFNNTSLAASGSGQLTVAARYTMDYPTTVSPLIVDVQSGANAGEITSMSLDRVSLATLGLPNTVDVTTQPNAQVALDELNDAIATLGLIRSRYGAYENRLQHTLESVTQSVIQLAKAQSQIRDADMASLTMSLTRSQVLQQSGTEVHKIATSSPQMLLSLLNG